MEKNPQGPPPPYSQPSAPQPGFNVPQQQTGGYVSAGGIQTVVIQQAEFGPQSQRYMCPSCHAEIMTRVEYEPSTKTHLFALILCLFQCYCCCCIPYCVDSCQNANHYCPNCGTYVGAYKN